MNLLLTLCAVLLVGCAQRQPVLASQPGLSSHPAAERSHGRMEAITAKRTNPASVPRAEGLIPCL